MGSRKEDRPEPQGSAIYCLAHRLGIVMHPRFRYVTLSGAIRQVISIYYPVSYTHLTLPTIYSV